MLTGVEPAAVVGPLTDDTAAGGIGVVVLIGEQAHAKSSVAIDARLNHIIFIGLFMCFLRCGNIGWDVTQLLIA